MNTGKTMIEKIFFSHSKDRVCAKEIIWLDIDVRSARDFGGASVIQNLKEKFKTLKLENPSKTFFTFDCNVPANTSGYADNQQLIRTFARNNNLKLFDVNEGIGSHVMIEEKIARPGLTLVGTDSHLNIMGAIGCFGQGMGDMDVAIAMYSGKTWFEVPETVKINIDGVLKSPASAKDVVLMVLQKFGASDLLGKAIEITGDFTEKLSLDERITIASMATELGAIILFFPLQKGFLKTNGYEENLTCLNADKDAVYSAKFNLSLKGLVPLISLPGNPENVTEVAKIKGKPIDSVVIGSCTNGRIEDMRIVANLLKGKKVNSNVMMKIVPATKLVYGQSLDEGLIKIFYDAGAVVGIPGCAGCAAGQIGITGKGEVQITTSNRNFTGKQGKGDTYLASPYTATVSALAGFITT